MARPTKPKELKPKSADEGDAKESSSKGGGGGGGFNLDIKFILTIVAIFLCSTLASVASVYFIAPLALEPALAKISVPHGEGETPPEGEVGETEKPKHAGGMNLELDEFTVNLKTEPVGEEGGGGNEYLRAKMALTITVPEAEDCHHPAAEHAAWKLPAKSNQLALAQTSGVLIAANLPGNNIPTLNGQLAGAALPVSEEVLIANEGAAAPSCPDAFKEKMAQFVPAMRDIINTALMKRTAVQLSTTEGTEALKDEIKQSINQLLDEQYRVSRVNFQDFIIQR